jgi:site-specific DNA-methyltransferase (adenine-specific)
MKLVINPVYQKLVPPVSTDEYESIKNSIKTNGLWLPIIVNPQGIILDGHTRFKICQELGITPKHAERIFENKTDEIIFVGESNLKRRQLHPIQRIALVRKLEPHYKEKAEMRRKLGLKQPSGNISGGSEKGDSRDKLGDIAGVSGKTYEKGVKVLDKTNEDTIQKIINKNESIDSVYRDLQKQQKKEQRQKEIKNLQVMLPENVTLHNSEFQKVFIEGNSVSLIFTDPPYHEKYLHLYESLAIHASRVLREGGSLICYAGHYAIGKIINMMEAQGLHFHWPIAVIHAGPSASVFGRKILVGYKPMLWFTKGKYEGEFVKDCIKSEFQGKELHEWAQSTVESDYYIKYLTLENEIVYDPFLGQGTFGISAVKQNRQFIGCEVDKDHFENARRLISAAHNT